MISQLSMYKLATVLHVMYARQTKLVAETIISKTASFHSYQFIQIK